MKLMQIARACVLSLLALPAPSFADPIAITSGYFQVVGVGASASFDIRAGDLTATGSLEPGVVWPDLTCVPCAAGEVIRLDTEFLGSIGDGSATVGDTTFPQVSFSAFNFLFGAPTIVAPDARTGFSITRPFTFSGRLLGSENVDQQLVYFTRMLTGQGLLEASFVSTPNPDGPPLFSFESIRYNFTEPEPVPEPATILLCATGLGAAFGYRRRRRPA